MPQLDIAQFPSQLVWLAISFVVLYVVSSRHILPRLSELMLERKTREADDIESATNLNAEAESHETEAQRLIEQAQQQAHRYIQTQLSAAKQEAQTQLDEQLKTALAQFQAQETARLEQAKLVEKDVEQAATRLADVVVTNLLTRPPTAA